MLQDISAVRVKDLTVAYDSKPVLWDIDLEIPRGALAALICPNGAGKTTLIKAMLGLLKPVTGSVRFTDIAGRTIDKSNHLIGYVPQSESVDWDFPATVLEVVMMGRYGHLGWLKRPGKKEKEMAMETLEKIGMDHYAKRQISRLSGGQQQRVFLARALIQQADIYFMDEPFKGVDARTEKSIIGLLKELKECGKTVVVVHHALNTVADYFDWVTLINMKIIANGPVREVFHDKNLGLAYRNAEIVLKETVRP